MNLSQNTIDRLDDHRESDQRLLVSQIERSSTRWSSAMPNACFNFTHFLWGPFTICGWARSVSDNERRHKVFSSSVYRDRCFAIDWKRTRLRHLPDVVPWIFVGCFETFEFKTYEIIPKRLRLTYVHRIDVGWTSKDTFCTEGASTISSQIVYDDLTPKVNTVTWRDMNFRASLTTGNSAVCSNICLG